MKPRIHALTLLAILLVPLVAAAPIATQAVTTVQARWGWNSLGGYCPKEAISITTVHVNARLLVDMQSSTNGIGASVPTNTKCALPIVAATGVFLNPCQLLKGEVGVPALTTDPYFTRDSYGIWTKSIHFPDGGRVDLHIHEQSFFTVTYGDCRSGTAWGTWDGHYHAIPVG